VKVSRKLEIVGILSFCLAFYMLMFSLREALSMAVYSGTSLQEITIVFAVWSSTYIFAGFSALFFKRLSFAFYTITLISTIFLFSYSVVRIAVENKGTPGVGLAIALIITINYFFAPPALISIIGIIYSRKLRKSKLKKLAENDN
jgi:hypothetical protein